jgi:hypothetical protein
MESAATEVLAMQQIAAHSRNTLVTALRNGGDGDRCPTPAIFIRMRIASKENIKLTIIFRRAEEHLSSASPIRHFLRPQPIDRGQTPGQTKKSKMNEVICVQDKPL